MCIIDYACHTLYILLANEAPTEKYISWSEKYLSCPSQYLVGQIHLIWPLWLMLWYQFYQSVFSWSFVQECITCVIPDSKVHGAHLGPTGPRWAPRWPHELCYLGCAVVFTKTKQKRSASVGYCLNLTFNLLTHDLDHAFFQGQNFQWLNLKNCWCDWCETKRMQIN